MASVHLDGVERVPLAGEGGVAWLPVRAVLGIGSFGVNVWAAAEAGAEVIGPHVETEDQAAGHEELYVVLRGTARLRIGGDEIDAPVGTFLAVTDPAVERGAVALQPGTSVLAVGGVPRRPYRVAAWEFVVRALARYRDGDFAGAIDELEPALELHPGASPCTTTWLATRAWQATRRRASSTSAVPSPSIRECGSRPAGSRTSTGSETPLPSAL